LLHFLPFFSFLCFYLFYSFMLSLSSSYSLSSFFFALFDFSRVPSAFSCDCCAFMVGRCTSVQQECKTQIQTVIVLRFITLFKTDPTQLTKYLCVIINHRQNDGLLSTG
jgi:hypothetical protein